MMNAKSSKKVDQTKSLLVFEVDPTECPFREFRDNELSTELWGLGPAACRATMLLAKTAGKPPADHVWADDQIQPLPRSVRKYLHGWIRAEDLAANRWDAETVIFEDNEGGKMNCMDIQLSHAQVLLRSSFCRKVLSACYILERADGLLVENQWENFMFNFGSEGWRARYHIYSPGMKPGGGQQHRPGLSKNGCYLVRLFYLGAWRCVWVSDQVPVDATDSPLLPFSPLLTRTPAAKPGPKQGATTVTSSIIHIWPLLICKALLKLAAPDMNSDEDVDSCEDEPMPEFDIIHALTGCVTVTYDIDDKEKVWTLLTREVPVFAWDEDDDTLASTVKSRSTKKPTTKDTSAVRRGSMTTIMIEDTKQLPSYYIPGITPAHTMNLLVSVTRDLPLKKPLPEPELALWKQYRWVDWARRHGLYEAYDCSRTKFLKVSGLLKLSHAPQLLDVQSTESITLGFIVKEDDEKILPNPNATKKVGTRDNTQKSMTNTTTVQNKEELRDWVLFDPLYALTKSVSGIYYPSMYQFTSAASSPTIRITKGPPNRSIDIQASKSAPMYLQIDGPDENVLRFSLSVLHPRIMFNCGVPVMDQIESAYVLLEEFEWFVDCDLPVAKSYVQTRGYDAVEISFEPGRHYCRLWVHSRMNWHLMLLSESSLLLGTRDVIQCAAVRECPWASRFLSNLGAAFTNWSRSQRSTTVLSMINMDREFYKSYQPDLTWSNEEVGCDKSLLHWMFRQALQSLLMKRLLPSDFQAVCLVLKRLFRDPDFGFSQKPLPSRTFREIVASDSCDCVMPEVEEVEETEEHLGEQDKEEKVLVNHEMMDNLLRSPTPPVVSQVCELATEEVPCGLLKEEREKVIRRHEAATILQAHWRGTWARKCLRSPAVFSTELFKLIQETAFGNLESLSALMNEFFAMYPSAKRAYSVASALSGSYGLHQHHGTTYVSPKCKWIPYFQGVFYCHAPVKVHFDIQSSLQHCIVGVYDNDTGVQISQVYNSHITFDFKPNNNGYTVMEHGVLNQPSGANTEAHWQLTVLSSIDEAFHICDNDVDFCKPMPLQSVTKLHLDEIFLPNRRNILGGVQISVTKHEAVSFRAAATCPELQIEAVLRTTIDGEVKELGRCSGKGELYWPYIKLEQPQLTSAPDKRQAISQANLTTSSARDRTFASARSLKLGKSARTPGAGVKIKSATKLKNISPEPKIYTIEVIASNGWPLTLAQWKRVDEIRNSQDNKLDFAVKKLKEKPTSAKEKEKDKPHAILQHQLQPGDAYVELECSVSNGGGASCKRDDERDEEFAAARRAWDAKEPGRNHRGAQIRKDFRAEFLEALPAPPSESLHGMEEEHYGEEFSETGEEIKATSQQRHQGPTPQTDSEILEEIVENEEEALYLTMPAQLKDKFVPLYFVPICTKEKNEEESVIMTPDIAEAAKQEKLARIDAAVARMRELQQYNEIHVLGRQRRRCYLLEKFFVDSQWSPKLAEVLEERDNVVALEALNLTLSANKKKQDVKKK